ncbi:hypothetical protein [Desulfuromonas sp. AOP6]|uniref:hypothetical protein n=1 Tax=Desulfuromonas sp. AOP6 TaxID=1566351 RepID=UPI00127EFCF4|nr:hypothetical protein [Desulfuromonas sp. AOP6]BCA79150.1 hypothetical protein AOP6_0937 [Desulfuromonas sp. AOP6]
MELLLRQSLTGYQELFALNEEILVMDIQSGPEAIDVYSRRLKDLLVEIKNCDKSVETALLEESPTISRQWLLQRQELMQRIEAQNRLISEKIRGMMSVISAEIGQLRGGMTAMSGYHGDRDHKGSVLKDSC